MLPLSYSLRQPGLLLAASALLLSGLASARAQNVTEHDSSLTSAGSYTVSTTNDLLYQATPTASTNTASFSLESSEGLPALTDGTFGNEAGVGGQSNASSATAGQPYGGASATYSLGTNLAGYSITSTEVYTGWNDSGRIQPSYTLSYSTVAAPTTFINLATVYYLGGNDYQGHIATETQLVPTTGPDLATGVADVMITFNGCANGYTGYREFVVDGAPVGVVPEPSTDALMCVGLGIGALFVRARARWSV